MDAAVRSVSLSVTSRKPCAKNNCYQAAKNESLVFWTEFDLISSLTTPGNLLSAGIQPPPCGLSLWQREDGQLPAEESGQGQRQDQGNGCQQAFVMLGCIYGA